jgi:aryl-alcohol dehydrogenase-like predicted oxidoreductase
MNKISKIGIGTVQFGMSYGISNTIGKTDLEEIAKILSIAKDNKINTIDTANAYGESEIVLGQIGVSAFDVVTKFNTSQNEICTQQFKDSLSKLKLDKVYGLLTHSVQNLVKNPSLWDTILKYKEMNLVSKIGFSFNSVNEIDAVTNLGIKPDLIQIPYNILDNRFIEIAQHFKSEGCEIHSRSAYLQGLFFCDADKLNVHFETVKPFIKALQNSTNTLSADLLNHCLVNNTIDKVIIGVNNSLQLLNTLNGLNESKVIDIELPTVDEMILVPSNWK